MNAIKTTAIVEDANHLKLETDFNNLKSGTRVDLVIIITPQRKKKSWHQVLKRIGTYSEEDLAGFIEARKEINKWQPAEF